MLEWPAPVPGVLSATDITFVPIPASDIKSRRHVAWRDASWEPARLDLPPSAKRSRIPLPSSAPSARLSPTYLSSKAEIGRGLSRLIASAHAGALLLRKG